MTDKGVIMHCHDAKRYVIDMKIYPKICHIENVKIKEQ